MKIRSEFESVSEIGKYQKKCESNSFSLDIIFPIVGLEEL